MEKAGKAAEGGGKGLSREAALAALDGLASPCRLCPRSCGARRRQGETGFCGTGFAPQVASAGPHFGEEAVLVGRGGSGTIFLGGCNLGCAFCQNDGISRPGAGQAATVESLARLALDLAALGCHNINFVTPTHQAHAVARAVARARDLGLSVPVVYNSSGYESLEALRLLEGLVQVYMPDAKFSRPDRARRLCGAPDYPEVLRAALGEMHRQVGDLAVEGGLARSGLLVRHLVMPGGAEEGAELMDFLADGVSDRTWVNVMGQYRPAGRAAAMEGVDRRPRAWEVRAVAERARQRGLRLDPEAVYRPGGGR